MTEYCIQIPLDSATILRCDLGDQRGRLATCVRELPREFVGEERLILASIEGAENQPWPPSPPLQHAQLLSNQPHTILATGMANTTHWSASIEADPAQRRITWDVACRCKQRPEFLGCQFRVGPGLAVEPSGQALNIHGGGREYQLIPAAAPAESAVFCEETALGTKIVIRPASPNMEYPGTSRWKFQLDCQFGGPT